MSAGERAMKAVAFIDRHLLRALAIACVVQVILVVAFFPRGVFSVDEVTQALMLRALVHEGALSESTRGLASPELAYALVRTLDGRLVPQYPHGFAFVTAPLYAALGLRGPMIVNSIAFYATAALVARIARLLFPQRSIALLATVIYVLATFSWEYGPAVWPHTSTVFLTTLAMAAAVHASFATHTKPRLGYALGAGVAVGLATTFRLDGIFVIVPVLLAPAVLTRARVSTWAAMALGLVPGLAFLSITNQYKFGTVSPFSYGVSASSSPTGGIDRYLPFGVAAIVGLAMIFTLSRRPPMSARRVHFRLAMVGLALVAVASFAPARRFAVELAHGLVMLGIDLRHSDPNVVEPALERSASGAMVYIGSFKKSLLQSLPYLPVALSLFGLARLRERRALVVVAAAALVPFVIFCAFRWHGGMSFNLRYLLPILPFTSILVAVALRRLLAFVPARLGRELDLIVMLSVLAFIVIVFVFKPQAAASRVQERFFLDVPLAIAALVAVGALLTNTLGGRVRSRRSRARFVDSILVVGAGVGLAWASGVAFTYDALASMHRRAFVARTSASVRPLIAPGSLLFVHVADQYSKLIEDDVQLAVIGHDGSADAPRLARAAACSGRSVFMAGEGLGVAAAGLVDGTGLAVERLRDKSPELLRVTSTAPCSLPDARP